MSFNFLRTLFCALAWLPTVLSAQFNTWSGGVIDAENMEGVPYAIVQAEGTGVGVTTNAHGEFTLKIPSDKSFTHFKVICMGYKTATVPIPSKTPTTHLELILTPDGVEVQGITISQERLEAKQYAEEAMRKMKENNPTFPFTLRGFYRHYCRDGEKYGRLIEAAADIHDRKGYPNLANYQNNRFSYTVTQLRRSYDYSSLYTRDHSPISIAALVGMDPLAYPSRLNDYHETLRKLNKNYTFAFGNSTMMDGHPVQVVEYTYINTENGSSTYAINEKNEVNGKIYIDAESMAILEWEEDIASKTYFPEEKYRAFSTFNEKIRMGKWDGKYYPLKYESNSGYKVAYPRPEKPDSIGYDHWVHIEFQTNEVDRGEWERPDYQELDYFVLKAVPYDSHFWDGYNILKATPLEDSITADLERKMDLRTQFQTYHERVMRDQFDSTTTVALNNFEERFQNRPHILLFFQLSDTSIFQSKKFRKQFNKCLNAGIPPFLFSTDMNKEDVERLKKIVKKTRNYYVIREGERISQYSMPVNWGGYGLKSRVATRKGVTQGPTLVIEPTHGEATQFTQPLDAPAVIQALKTLRKTYKREKKQKERAKKETPQ